jgi:hypothetical protein
MARRAFLGLLIIAAPMLVIACGGAGKPSYCSSVDNLKSSIQALPKTDVVKNGTNGLKSAVDKVQSSAKAVVNSAKSDFPNESSALETSVNALTSAAKQLSSNPSAGAIAQVVSNVSGVSTAAKNFAGATSSKCS